MQPGDVFVLNAPYNGGTHLPDVTVIAPVFLDGQRDARVLRRVARPSRRHRRHHARLDAARLDARRRGGRAARQRAAGRARAASSRPRCARSSRRAAIRRATSSRTSPTCARRSRRARRARRSSRRWSAHFGLPVVRAYMQHVQDNAEEAVRRVLDVLTDGSFEYEMDSGARDRASRIAHRPREARGDDRLHRHERAAADQLQRAVGGVQGRGALRVPHARRRRDPDERRVPEAAAHRDSRRARCSRPRYPAAVVAGNVETSQAITDCAVRRARRARGVAGHDEQLHVRQRHATSTTRRSPAARAPGPDFDGASVVQTHMTNSRLTDPEVLEWRFPVRLESYRDPPRQRRRGPRIAAATAASGACASSSR